MSYEEGLERRRRELEAERLRESTEGTMFDRPVERPMVRSTDPETSEQAADRIRACLSQLQMQVFTALLVRGPLTGKQLEQLPQFKDCAPSTIRKRLTELHAGGYAVATGKVVDGCSEYRAVVAPACG